MSPVAHTIAVERSRSKLLSAIPAGAELTFVRGLGNRGDELIWAGTRQLLADRVFREISVDDLPSARGEIVLLAGSGAFSRAYHDWMPRALAIAERRFARVVVLPTSFDVRTDAVRVALERTRATVFAREARSFADIRGLCDAHLAHDGAFFFDFSAPAGIAGSGVLHAYREDLEAPGGPALPPGNDDISLTATSLDAWLQTIARHAVVRTDRAHVTIAAALMGKRVEYAPALAPKVQDIADEYLTGFDVRCSPRVGPPAPSAAAPPRPTATRRRLHAAATAGPRAPAPATDGPRVTAVVLTKGRAAHAARCVTSVLTEDTDATVLLLDGNSDEATRASLGDIAATDPRVRLRLADRALSCAAGRKLGTEVAQTEFVLFLDDDAELVPGALGHLVATLDAHPEALGVTALVVGSDGTVQHFGGWIERSQDVSRFTLDGSGEDPAGASVGATGPSGWLPGTAALCRTAAFDEFPIDLGMDAYYEDNEWSSRVVASRPDAFFRCREAVVLHHSAGWPGHGGRFATHSLRAERLAAHAHFHAVHGTLLGLDLDRLVPELCDADGRLDEPAARLLLGLVQGHGTDWLVTEWMNGGLEPLWRGAAMQALLAKRDELTASVQSSSTAREAAATAAAAASAASAAALEAAATAVAALEADLTAERSRSAALGEQVLEQQHLREFLQARHETLMVVEAGGWWRLRGRLQPALRLARAARRRVAA